VSRPASIAHPRTGATLALDLGCRACPLASGRTQVVVRRGRLDARVLFVGEAPGAEEDARGQPFVGRSGQLLDRWISELGIGDGWCITNVVRCRPPDNRKPARAEEEACWQHLEPFLAFVQPRVVVAVGNTAHDFLARKGIAHLRVKHPAWFVRGLGPWEPEVARLKAELTEALATSGAARPTSS
jgi:DNA polymerase